MRDIQQATGYQNYKHGDPWTHHHCTFYNGLLRIEMAPTRFVCERTLERMGIREQVRDMLQRIGMDKIAYQAHPLYPELVRQFLASAEFRYKDPAHHNASEGILSYFSSGVLYEISIPELCDLYGFDRTNDQCTWPLEFTGVVELWSSIASGVYESRGAKLTHIRNPVVRVVAKIISNILFAKEESGAVRHDELYLLHFGLPPSADPTYLFSPPSTLHTNLGVIFAEHLASKKARGLNTVNKKVERVGSLLTPLFIHHGIDLSTTPCEPKIVLFDEQYFRNSGILKPGYIYQFLDRTGATQFCKLPLRDFTALTCRANLMFDLPAEFLIQHSSAPRRRGSSSRAPASQTHQEDDHIPASHIPQAQFEGVPEYLLPPFPAEHDLPPRPVNPTEAEFREWMMESHTRTHSVMRRIWDALARIRCPAPSCLRPSPPRSSRATTEQPPPVEEEEDHLDHDSRLPRRRRRPGQSRSVSPEDH